MKLITPARLALLAAAWMVAVAAIAFSEDAAAAASTPCEDAATLQQRLDGFDARWNASDAWGLTAQFAPEATLGASGGGSHYAVYRQIVDQLGQPQRPVRRSQLVRATPVGDTACLVDVLVSEGDRVVPTVMVLGREGIVAMRQPR
jgi:hypothetical protein